MPEAVAAVSGLVNCSPEIFPLIGARSSPPMAAETEAATQAGVSPLSAEAGSGHIGVLRVHVLRPSHRSILYTVPDTVLTTDAPTTAVFQSCPPLQSVHDTLRLVPVLPQLSSTAVTALAVPSWVFQSFRRVIVLDFTAFGGPSFAAFTWEQVTLKDLREFAVSRGISNWQAFVALAPNPVAATFRVNNGDLIRFAPPGSSLAPRLTLAELLGRGVPIGPDQTSTFLERASSDWLVLCEDSALTVPDTGSQPRIRQAALEAMLRRGDQVRFSEPLPGTFVADYVYQGRTLGGIIAAAVPELGVRTGPPEGDFVFLDCRQIGRDLRYLLADAGPCPAGILFKHLQIRVPVDYRPAVSESAEAFRDSATVMLDHGSLLTVMLLPDNHTGPGHEPAVSGPAPSNEPEPTPAEDCLPRAPRLLGTGPGRLTTSSDDEVSSTDVATAQFVVLRLDCAPVEVGVAFRTPASVETVLDAVSATLPDGIFPFYPQVVEVSPQPSSQWGLVLALPQWANAEPIVVIDATKLDGRIFALAIGPVVSRQHLCHLARLDPDEVDIYAYGSASPLVVDADLLLEPYRCIFCVPKGEGPAVGHSLHNMVLHPYGWSHGVPSGSLHAGSSTDMYCLATVICNILHRMQAHTEAQVLPELATALHLPVVRTHVQAGVPRITDACLQGFACRNVLAIARLPDDEEAFYDQSPQLALVDCRPMLQGWHVLFVYGQRVSHSELASQLSHFAPDGHHVQLEHTAFEDTHLLIQAGQVILAHFAPSSPVSALEGAESESGTSDAADSGLDGTDEDSMGQDTTTAPADSEGEHLFADDPRFAHGNSRSRSRSRGREHACITEVEPRPQSPECNRDSGTLATGGSARAPCLARSRSRSPSRGLEGIVVINSVAGASATSPFCVACTPPLGLSWHFWSFCLLLGVTVSWLLMKWLAEPDSSRPREQFAIASLRLLARHAGLPWRYVPGHTAIAFRTDSDSDEEVGRVDQMRALPLVILTPDFPAFYTEVHLPLPAAQEEVIQQAQAARTSFSQTYFPRVTPTFPQTVAGRGIFVADVGWTHEACILCIDATRFDRRLFAVRAPAYVSREELLRLANVRANLGVEVFLGGDTQPLAAHTVHHVLTGLTILLLPDGVVPPVPTLGQNLLSPAAWQQDSPPLASTAGHAYCLATDSGAALFLFNSRARLDYRQQIAASLSQDDAHISLFQANPRVTDAVCDGLPCRAVIAVCSRPLHFNGRWFGVVVDARAFFLGWWAVIAYDGRVSSAAVLAPFWPCCPDGWRPCISHVPVDQEVLAAYEGQVLQVLPRPCTALDARLASPAASGEVSGPPVPTPAGSRNIRREPSALETAPDFGPTVPTGSTGHDPGETSSTLTETAGPVETPPFFEGLFAVIGQDYCPELVHVRLPTGTHVAEALRCINAAREPGPRLCLPRLLAVHPQTVAGIGLLVAAPIWEPPGLSFSSIVLVSMAHSSRFRCRTWCIDNSF